MARGNSVAGKVVDDAGEPISGARVVARDFSRGASEVNAITRADGSFTINKLVSEESVEVEVIHDEYSTYMNEAVEVGSTDMQIVLVRLGKLVGTVRNSDGESVAFNMQPQREGRRKASRKQLRSKPFNSEDGHFEYNGVPAGVYTVHFRAPSHGSAKIDGVRIEAGEVIDLGEVVLAMGSKVAGVVIDSVTGEPIEKALVSIIRGFRGGKNANRSQHTDVHGRFSLEGLSGGDVTLRIRHEDYVQSEFAANSDIADDISLELDPGSEVIGSVLDNDGQPVKGMKVYLVGDRASVNQNSSSDQNGRFHFKNVAPGRYDVRAHAFGKEGQAAQHTSVDVDVEAGQAHEVLLHLP